MHMGTMLEALRTLIHGRYLYLRNGFLYLLQIFDFFTMRHLHRWSRGRTLFATVGIILFSYSLLLAMDYAKSFEELSQQVRKLNVDLEIYKRRALYLEHDAKSTKQHQVAREVLHNLGPAVLKPLVRKKPPDAQRASQAAVNSGPKTPNGSVPLQIINPHDFNYILNNETLCKGSDSIEYIVYVHSSPHHFQHRQTLRETWAQRDLFESFNSRVIFFLGKTSNTNLQEEIVREFTVYGDIIQEDFQDDYYNLTYKGIGALKWIATYCSQTKYVFKSDDDTFVNIFMLVHLLQTKYIGDHRILMCMWWDKMPIMTHSDSSPDRVQSSLTDRHFPGQKFFSRYCSGSAFFLSGDVIGDLYNASLRTAYFWIDDVYITGLLPSKVTGMTWRQEMKRYLYNISAFQKHYESSETLTLMVTITEGDELAMKRCWYLALIRLSSRDIEIVGEAKHKHLLEHARTMLSQAKT